MKFYAVVAEDGVSVADSWAKAENAVLYLSGFRYPKGFGSFKDANEFALKHLREIAPGKKIPNDLPRNHVVRVSALEDLIIPFTVSGRPQNLDF